MPRRYTDADLAALLVKQGHPVEFKFRKNRKLKDPNVRTESQEQQELIKWWALVCGTHKIPERLLMAFPLQGARTKQNGARLKAEGMRAGTPDLFLAVPRGKYHGLWVEMKTAKGVLSDAQKLMLADLDVQHYAAFACYSFDQASELIVKYLSGEEFF